MEHFSIDPIELELRKNQDFIASQKMIGEGSPVYGQFEENEPDVKKQQEQSGFHVEQLPRDYQ